MAAILYVLIQPLPTALRLSRVLLPFAAIGLAIVLETAMRSRSDSGARKSFSAAQ